MTIPVRQCIRQVQMGDVDAIADICQLYNPFIQSMARKYSYVYGSIHDARSVATTALIECIYSYDLADNVDVPPGHRPARQKAVRRRRLPLQAGTIPARKERLLSRRRHDRSA